MQSDPNTTQQENTELYQLSSSRSSKKKLLLAGLVIIIALAAVGLALYLYVLTGDNTTEEALTDTERRMQQLAELQGEGEIRSAEERLQELEELQGTQEPTSTSGDRLRQLRDAGNE